MQETEENWRWYLQQLKKSAVGTWLQQKDKAGISDRFKGIAPALENELPDLFGAACLRHICQNMHDSNNKIGKFSEKAVWSVAHSKTYDITDQRFAVLDKNNARAAEYLGKVPRKLFVTAYCPDHIAMYGLKCSNLAESKNFALLPARSELALGFLDKSLEHLMGQVTKIRVETQKWDLGQVLTPYAEAIYKAHDADAARCSAQESGSGLFYVAYTASQNAH